MAAVFLKSRCPADIRQPGKKYFGMDVFCRTVNA